VACGHRAVDVDPSTLGALYHQQYSGFVRDPFFEKNVRVFLEDQIVSRVGRDATLLDVGCGNGVVLEVAGAIGLRAQGIDLSEAAVQSCTARGLDAVVGDFPGHSFPDSSFDVITFWDVLEHLPRPRAFVDRATVLLRPGGWLLIKVPGHGVVSVLAGAMAPKVAGAVLQIPHHVQLFTRASVRRLLGESFDDVVWLSGVRMRSPTRGGSLKSRVVRGIVGAVTTISRDENLVMLARRAAA
jgi:2-polyprenyl-3-methyl-5-hydroxy-6-metoxy-1,4-benzoquinol methylase